MITIKEARTQANLTQTQLADRYGIPVRTLQDWESGRRTPPEYVVTLLLRCIEVDFGIHLKATADARNMQTYTLTYADDRPLTLADEMFVNVEKEAKRIELIKIDSPTVKTYRCSNGFTFKAKLNKQDGDK